MTNSPDGKSQQSRQNLINKNPSASGSPSKDNISNFASDKTGRGKNLKNDDVPEVSEDEDEHSLNKAKLEEDDNQQAEGGPPPTYRDMDDEDQEQKSPINRYSPTTPKQMQHEQPNSNLQKKFSMKNANEKGPYTQLQPEDNKDLNQSMESYEFDSKNSGSVEESYPEIAPQPVAKVTSGGLRKTDSKSVTRTVPVSNLSPKKQA